MKYSIILFAILFTSFIGCKVYRPLLSVDQSIKVSKIWAEAPHNAFTDIIRFNNAFYCVFREGLSHVSGPNGSARIIKSDDGKNWRSVASFKLDDLDIRDPKVSIDPNQRMMVLMDVESYKDGKVATRKPYVSFSDPLGENFSAPKESVIDPTIVKASDWIWRVTWNNQIGYGIDYQPGGIFLVSTKDGSYFQKVSAIDVDGSPNESTIRFDKNGKMYVLIRREGGDKLGVLATSLPPYQQWEFNKLDRRLGGPDFIFLNDTTLCIGSRYFPDEKIAGSDRYKNPKTALFISDLKGKIFKTIELPSGGDNSYPGMLIYKDTLWCSYYSSHEGKKASIYLAKIPMKKLLF